MMGGCLQSILSFTLFYYITVLLYNFNNVRSYFSPNRLLVSDLIDVTEFSTKFYFLMFIGILITIMSIIYLIIIHRKKLSNIHMVYPVFDISVLFLNAFLLPKISGIFFDFEQSLVFLDKTSNIDIVFYLFSIIFCILMIYKIIKKK